MVKKAIMTNLMTPDEVAEYLGVQKSTIYQWTHQGFIPHYKLGKNVRFRQVIIDRWLDKRAVEGRLRRNHNISESGFESK